MNFSVLKNFWRARAQNILPPMPKNHDFCIFTAMWDSARAARGSARAPNFFWKCNLYDKISLQIFLFGHNSKSEFFRAIWSLKFFLKFHFFPKIFKFWKFSKKIKFFLKKFKKSIHFKAIHNSQFNRYENISNT